MAELERIVIVDDGKYVEGYRKKYTALTPLLIGNEKCFKKQIDYKKIKDQAMEVKVGSIFKELNKYIGLLDFLDKKNICIEAMEGLKKAKTKSDLDNIFNDFFINVNRGNKIFYNLKLSISEKEERNKEVFRIYSKVKLAYNTYKDLMMSMLIKKITRTYYSIFLSGMEKDTIVSLEEFKVNYYDKENVLDLLLESVGENSNDTDNDFYNLRKMILSDMISKKHDSYYEHLCGSELSCSKREFAQCAKIYSGSFDEIKIDEFPFINRGLQIEIQNEKGEWITDKMLVSECDFKRSYEVRRKLLNKKNRFI